MKRLFLLLLIMILPLCMACSKPYDFEGPYLTKEIYLTNSPYGGLLGRRIKIDKRTLYIDFNEIGKLKRVNLLYDKDASNKIDNIKADMYGGNCKESFQGCKCRPEESSSLCTVETRS